MSSFGAPLKLRNQRLGPHRWITGNGDDLHACDQRGRKAMRGETWAHSPGKAAGAGRDLSVQSASCHLDGKRFPAEAKPRGCQVRVWKVAPIYVAPGYSAWITGLCG